MKQLLASITAAAFLTTGTAIAANLKSTNSVTHVAKVSAMKPTPKPTKKPWNGKGMKPGKPAPRYLRGYWQHHYKPGKKGPKGGGELGLKKPKPHPTKKP